MDFATGADFDELAAAHSIIMAVEAAGIHDADFSVRPDDFGPRIRASIERGFLTPAVAYVRRASARGSGSASVYCATCGKFDVLLTPSTPSAAPRDLTTTGNMIFPESVDHLRLPPP